MPIVPDRMPMYALYVDQNAVDENRQVGVVERTTLIPIREELSRHPMTDTPDPSGDGPFRVGTTYRAKKDFTALRDSFKAGQFLTFIRCGYSWYHGIRGFFFSQPGSDEIRVWDIYDGDDIAIWQELFEEVPVSAP
jgi:hypothetical protein